MLSGWYYILCVASLPALYIAVLTLGALLVPLRRRRNAAPALEGPLAIVIPAHNESASIVSTLESLSHAVDTETSVHVIADNCSDDTAEKALAAFQRFSLSGKVWIRFEPTVRSKGAALAWALPRIQAGAAAGIPFAAFGFYDVGSRVDPQCVVRAREAFGSGARALQGANRIHGDASWRERLVTVTFTGFNVTRGLGKLFWGLSDTIKGTGFWLKADVLHQVPWSTISATEDFEYSLSLARAGIRVHFIEGCEVVSAFVEGAENEAAQRVRWEGGRLSALRRHWLRLTWDCVRHPDWLMWQQWMEWTTPPLAFLVLSYGALFALAPWNVAWIPLLAIGLIFLHAVATVFVNRLPPRFCFALFRAPFYIFWKLSLLSRLLRSSQAPVWEERDATSRQKRRG